MPDIDLHFWVVEDNKIIDGTITDEFKKACRMFNAEQLVYLPYPADVNETIVKKHIEEQKERMIKKGKTWEQCLLEGRYGNHNNLFSCIASSICHAHWYGGKVQVGCFGYKTDKKIHWLFGHPDNSYDDYERNNGDTIAERDTDIIEHEGKLVWGQFIKKQQPNELCNCGSNKKYKKCCIII